MTLGKFLFIAVMLGLPAGPALAQSYPESTAHMGEISPRDIDAYHARMNAAMAMTDTARRDAAVARARQQLARDTRKPLAAGTIAELDGLLDIGGISPQLGASG